MKIRKIIVALAAVLVPFLVFRVGSGLTEQQNVIPFEVFFAAFCNVMNIGNVFTKLFLNHFCDVFGITGVAAEKDASDCHE